MLFNFTTTDTETINKYKSNDDREIEEQARIIECFYRTTERIEEHDVRKHLPTYLSNV